MILTPHLAFGAAIGIEVAYLPLAIILALLSHYILDIIPHTDYSIKNLKDRKWDKTKVELVRVAADGLVGLLLIFVMWEISDANLLHVLIPAFFGAAPDLLSFLLFMFPKNRLLRWHYNIHRNLHFLENKKISRYWRVLFQLLVVVVSFLIIRH